MATVILIVFIAVVAILGGWWLKRERENQKTDLIRKGKLAAGKFDEVVLPKKKPKKRKRKKREGNFWDPKYVPPEIPSRQQLDGWLARAAQVVDELLPALNAYRTGRSNDELLQRACKVAEAELVTAYKSDALTDVEALEWLEKLEAKLRAYNDAKAEAEVSARAVRKLYNPAKDLGFDLRRLIMQANDWELYKAPEPFHEKLELVTLLLESIKWDLDLDNAQPGNSGDRSNRRFNSGDNQFNWQGTGSSRRRKSWNNWGATEEPEPEPLEDTQIVGRTRQVLVETLTHVAALASAIADASASQKKYFETGKHIALTRPSKPTDQDVDAVLVEAVSWAKAYQAAKVQAYNEGVKMRRCIENAKRAIRNLQKAVATLNEAVIPEQDRVAKDVIGRACEQLLKYYEAAPKSVNTLTELAAPYALDKQDAQSDKDATSNLRNLMRKAAYAMAQSEVAKANYEAAKGEHVSQAETVPPVLSQSSASAFVNAHARMTEIRTRNSQKTEAHSAKVKQLSGQASEREQQAKQAVRAVNTALNSLSSKKEDWSASLELMRSAASLFYGAFNK